MVATAGCMVSVVVASSSSLQIFNFFLFQIFSSAWGSSYVDVCQDASFLFGPLLCTLKMVFLQVFVGPLI